MTKLSVNVNKLATLRNSRGKNNPDVLKTTLDIITYGAQGITVHPRPDGRHIRREDVYAISKAINVEFNMEGYPDHAFLELVKAIKPTQCTLVPDPPHVLTSNAGWEIEKNKNFLYDIIHILHQNGIRTSLFIDPMRISPKELEALAGTKTDRIELYTESFAHEFGLGNKNGIEPYVKAAELANELGLGINAGHDLSLDNIQFFKQNIPGLLEVSIGHALICESLYLGLDNVVNMYLNKLN